MSALAAMLQMIFNGVPRRIELSTFLSNTDRAGVGATPPMIQHPRNMMNPIGLLGNTKEKVVILRAVEFRSESADFLDNVASRRSQMADVIV